MKITLSELRQLVRNEVRNSGVSRRRLNESIEFGTALTSAVESVMDAHQFETGDDLNKEELTLVLNSLSREHLLALLGEISSLIRRNMK